MHTCENRLRWVIDTLKITLNPPKISFFIRWDVTT